jgi:hypothetical protein
MSLVYNCEGAVLDSWCCEVEIGMCRGKIREEWLPECGAQNKPAAAGRAPYNAEGRLQQGHLHAEACIPIIEKDRGV